MDERAEPRLTEEAIRITETAEVKATGTPHPEEVTTKVDAKQNPLGTMPPPAAPYTGIITMEPGKRAGKPCIRGLRITVYDVLSYLAAGMTAAEIVEDFPDLTPTDIHACLAYAAERERRTLTAV